MPNAPKKYRPPGYKPRGTAHQRGYTHRWNEYSKWYRHQNPLCVLCKELAQCVDHIRPITGPDDPGFWDSNNHRSLCIKCNTLEAIKQGGRVNRY